VLRRNIGSSSMPEIEAKEKRAKSSLSLVCELSGRVHT
jgi:hypothetical protein